MQVRLAFSVAIKAQGDILILDEVLAVGDEAFQRKCNDYFQERKKSGKTTILVTHDMGAVKKYCNKAVLIENGLVKAIGDPLTFLINIVLIIWNRILIIMEMKTRAWIQRKLKVLQLYCFLLRK